MTSASDKENEEPLLAEEALPAFDDDFRWFEERGAGGNESGNRKRSESKLGNALRVMVIVILLTLVIGVIVGVLAKNQIRDYAETRFVETVNRNGIHLDYDECSWSFVRGLVLNDVTVFGEDRKTPLITLTDMSVRVGPLDLLQSKSGSTDITTQDSTVVFYSNGNESKRIEGFTSVLELTGNAASSILGESKPEDPTTLQPELRLDEIESNEPLVIDIGRGGKALEASTNDGEKDTGEGIEKLIPNRKEVPSERPQGIPLVEETPAAVIEEKKEPAAETRLIGPPMPDALPVLAEPTEEVQPEPRNPVIPIFGD